MGLESCIRNFSKGKEANFVVLYPTCTPLMRYRMDRTTSLREKLLVLMMLGNDRAVKTYLEGEPAMAK
ncbi:hypothetical protein [Desulfonatronum lacustre]|uniref:hypothetical protein n=1 Tax=Desulfonatronum lacustre TaxID=66849 RepID=UPI0004B745CF|nr:hypothetical protein [Desulfonatronum lacustre]